jgi:O-antigen ligase
MAMAASVNVKPVAPPNIFQKIGALPLLLLVYLSISRVLDLRGGSLHIPLMLSLVAGAAVVLSGRLFAGPSTRVGAWYLALTCCFAASVLFSIWRHGSFDVLRIWISTLAAWTLVVGLTPTTRDCLRLLNTVAAASFTAAGLALLLGERSEEGRLILGEASLNNPNELALTLLIGLPFLWRLFASGGRMPILRRLFALGAGGVVLAGLVETGSRGGMYTLVVMLALAALRVSFERKIMIAVAAAGLFAVGILVMPNNLRLRYFTFSSVEAEDVHSQVDATAAGSAASSALNREMLFRESLAVTLRRPITGVGLGNFGEEIYRSNKEEGRPQEAYHVTHNTYTQISSEAGIPALVAFLGILVLSWRSMSRVIGATRKDPRPAAREIRGAAMALQVCLGGFAAFFVTYSSGYGSLPHMLIGMMLALSLAAERELAALGPAPERAAPAGLPGAPFARRPRWTGLRAG